MRDRRTNIFSIADVEELGPAKVVEMALDRAWDGCDAVYLSFDIDSIEVCRVKGANCVWGGKGGRGAGRTTPSTSRSILIASRYVPRESVRGGRGGIPGLRRVSER
jgi:hypothetical protein